jgi:hypothetical protein
MLPEILNLTGEDAFYRGDTKVFVFELGGMSENGTFIPDNITGISARIHFRAHPTEATTLKVFTTSPNGGLTIQSAANGLLEWEVKPADTADQDWVSGVYDLEITYPTGEVRTVLKGNVALVRDVTY